MDVVVWRGEEIGGKDSEVQTIGGVGGTWAA